MNDGENGDSAPKDTKRASRPKEGRPKRDEESVFFLALVLRGEFLLLLIGKRSVVLEFHAPGARTLRERVQTRRVAVKFGERNDGRDFHQTAGQTVGARNLTAAAREIAGDVAHVAFRRDDFHADDRFENLRRGLGERVEESLAAGDTKATSFESTGWCLPS